MRSSFRSIQVAVLTALILLFAATTTACVDSGLTGVVVVQPDSTGAKPDTAVKTGTTNKTGADTSAAKDTTTKTDTSAAKDTTSTDTTGTADTFYATYDNQPMTSGVEWNYRAHIHAYDKATGAEIQYVIFTFDNATPPAADCGASMQDETVTPFSADGKIDCTNTSNPEAPVVLDLHISPLDGRDSHIAVPVTLN